MTEQEWEKLTQILADKNQRLLDENAELKSIAFLDALTEVYNRNWFEYTFPKTPNTNPSARKLPQDTNLSLLDLNHLKSVNDSLGHKVGDNYLMHVVSQIIPFGEVVRYGGDEFLLLCENKRKFEEFSKMKSDLYSVGTVDLNNYKSMGHAINDADKLMYENKRDHKLGRVEKVGDFLEFLQDNCESENDIERTLADVQQRNTFDNERER